MSHTSEPWSLAEEAFDNDGIHESVIRGLDGRAAIAVTLEFGPNNPGMREANARRIVAAVNACASIPTEDLESIAGRIATKSVMQMHTNYVRNKSKVAALEHQLIGTLNETACLVALLSDIKSWDVSQYLQLPLDLRKRIQATLNDAVKNEKGGAA